MAHFLQVFFWAKLSTYQSRESVFFTKIFPPIGGDSWLMPIMYEYYRWPIQSQKIRSWSFPPCELATAQLRVFRAIATLSSVVLNTRPTYELIPTGLLSDCNIGGICHFFRCGRPGLPRGETDCNRRNSCYCAVSATSRVSRWSTVQW